MNPIKVGLIGFGRMGGFYLEEMQKSGNWDIVYICDVSPASRELAQRLSPRSKVISDEQIIFNNPEIQVVGLFALADSRPEQIQKAIASGKHVIAEKPIADTVEKEWQTVALAEKAKIFSTVVPQHHQGFYRTGRDRRTGDHPRMPHDTGAGTGRGARIRGPGVP